MKTSPRSIKKANKKVAKVMHEFKEGTLKSHGKKVTDYDQAIAIALSEARTIDANYQSQKWEGGHAKPSNESPRKRRRASMASGGKIENGTTVEHDGENYYVINSVKNYDKGYTYKIRNYNSGSTLTVSSDEIKVKKPYSGSMATGGRVDVRFEQVPVGFGFDFEGKNYHKDDAFSGRSADGTEKKFQFSTMVNVPSTVKWMKKSSGGSTMVSGGEAIDEEFEKKVKYLQSRSEKDLLPPIALYRKYLNIASLRFNITMDEARDKYGRYTTGQWEKLLGSEEHSSGGSMATGGDTKNKNMDCESQILPAIKEQVVDAWDNISVANELDNTDGEEIEHQSRDGFIPFTDGGWQISRFQTLQYYEGSGKRVGGTKKAEKLLADGIAQGYAFAQDQFKEEYPDIVKELGADKINYSDLNEAGYNDEAEKLSELEMDNLSDDNSTIMFELGASYYKPDNDRNEFKGKHSITVFGTINFEAPYHRHQDKWEDYMEHSFSFNSIDELNKKLRHELEKVLDWFKVSKKYAGGGKANSSVELSKKIKQSNKISEKEINLIKSRLNNDKADTETKELVQWIWDNHPELTEEQNKNGIDFLMNLWKSPTGKERSNSPYGYREQDALKTFKYFELAGFYDISKYGGRKFLVPLYNVIGEGSNFQYYYDRKVNIVGKDGGQMATGGEANKWRTGKKRFSVQYNVGTAKYVVSYHKGGADNKHKDGSDFFDIKLFNNKKEFEQFKKQLLSEGYLEEYSSGGSMEAGGDTYNKGGKINYPKERLPVEEQSIEERELQLFISNDADLYRQRTTPIYKNAMTKLARGNFDINLAPKLFMYLVIAGEEKYAKENMSAGEKILNKKQRENLAKTMTNEFLDEASLSNYENETFLPKKYLHEGGNPDDNNGDVAVVVIPDSTSDNVASLRAFVEGDETLSNGKNQIQAMSEEMKWDEARLHQQYKRIFSYMAETAYNKANPEAPIELTEEERNEFANMYVDATKPEGCVQPNIEEAKHHLAEANNALDKAEADKNKQGGVSTKKSSMSKGKYAMAGKIDKMQRALASDKLSPKARASMEKKLEKYRRDSTRRIPVYERIIQSQGKFFIEIPAEYRLKMNTLLHGANLKPRFGTLGDKLRITVDNRAKLNRLYKIYSDMLKKKSLPVPTLEQISGKPAKVKRQA